MRIEPAVRITTLIAIVFAAAFAGATAWAHGMPGDHVHELKYGGPLEYLWSGIRHMLTGYDHLLFLFGVMFFLTTFKEIVTFITAFTIGHSLTLIAATMLKVQADVYLIDAVIAFSVLYKGFDNLDGFRRWFGIAAPHMLGMVFAFGLIHGFGLATRVQQYGFPQDGLFIRLLAFNVGIEVGQILALVAMVAVLTMVRRTSAFAPFTSMANTFLLIAGSLLFLHQMHGYQHNAWPDEFGFNSNAHMIEHYSSKVPSPRANDKPLEMSPDDPGGTPRIPGR